MKIKAVIFARIARRGVCPLFSAACSSDSSDGNFDGRVVVRRRLSGCGQGNGQGNSQPAA
jgi:hypothetical protein